MTPDRIDSKSGSLNPQIDNRSSGVFQLQTGAFVRGSAMQ